MGFRPEDLIAVHPWRKVVFTTYALSLSFFESVVLDGLVRGRSKEALILADFEGVRAGLSEQGAQRAGRDYEVEPVAVKSGVFHPKISAFIGDDSHLVVGSGNLTFNGWGGNFEMAEHLHPSFAADAFDDAALFFMMLSDNPGMAHGVQDRCLSLAEDLSAAAGKGTRNGDIRLIHSLEGSIGERIAEFAKELGGAERLSVVAPFWDSGAAVDSLCKDLKLEAVHVHSHPTGTVHGLAGSNWPFAPEAEVIPVTVSDLSGGCDRKLHAKAFEIICKRGRVLVSGSANATSAALLAGNVEANIVRIQRERLLGWTLDPAIAPLPISAAASELADRDARHGILRATVTGEIIEGRVLSPAMSGKARLVRLTSEGDAVLGQVDLDETGSFHFSAPGFEAAAIRGGRVVLRIECGGQIAEGFASLTTVTGLRRFAGKAAASLLALLAGTETPDDVRVLMEWAHDNPGMLMPSFGSGQGFRSSSEPRPSLIDGKDLWNTQEAHGLPQGSGGGERSWTRFIDALLAAMRERRGAIIRDPDQEDEEIEEGRKRPEPKQPSTSTPKVLEIFETVFEAMLPKDASHEAVLRAFDLACYVCDRLGPDIHPEKAASWLRRLVDAFCANGTPATRPETVQSAIMALCRSDAVADGLRSARGRIKSVGGDPTGPCPPEEPALPFRAVMADLNSYQKAWAMVGGMRTWREQARSYCDKLFDIHPDEDFVELLAAVPTESGTMTGALETEQGRKKVIVLKAWQAACNCRIQLPKIEQGKLRTYGVARAANCCQKVLIWPEEAHG